MTSTDIIFTKLKLLAFQMRLDFEPSESWIWRIKKTRTKKAHSEKLGAYDLAAKQFDDDDLPNCLKGITCPGQ